MKVVYKMKSKSNQSNLIIKGTNNPEKKKRYNLTHLGGVLGDFVLKYIESYTSVVPLQNESECSAEIVGAVLCRKLFSF